MHKKKLHLTLTVSLILMITAFISLIVYFIYAYDLTVIPLKIRVASHVGFGIGNEGVDFGTTLPGGTVERTFTLKTKEEARITFYIKGLDFVYVTKDEIYAKPNSVENVGLIAKVDDKMAEGTYEGKLFILAKRI